jgi:hypothetical protein
MHRDVRQTNRTSRLIVSAVLTALLALTLPQSYAQSTAGPIPTDPNLKVAFVGDSGDGENFIRVLGLIKSESAVMVMHQGDFDYVHDPKGFFATVDSILGPDFPYFASVGNHDNDSWKEGCSNPNRCYTAFLRNRMARIGAIPDDPDLDDEMYAVTYRGLKMVFVGQDGPSYGDGIYAPYLQDQLATDDHIWRICSWHKNQNAMQVGGKDDEMGWKVYETCKDLGAIIATAHEHSYQRTKTLTSMQNQIVDASCSSPANLCVGSGSPGRSFVFVSGLGGASVRSEQRCLPAAFPYGCHGEWARIYTRDQGATFGALFITFNIDGDPRKAQGYFKNINGEIIDTFEIRADAFSSLTAARRPSAALLLSQAKLHRDRHSRQDRLSLQGSFVAPPDSINPPREGMTLSLTDADRHIVEVKVPAGDGWTTTRPGREWFFKRKKDGSQGNPIVYAKLGIQFNAETRRFDMSVKANESELSPPDVGPITALLTIGNREFRNTQAWRSTEKGKKLVAP